MRTAKQGSLDGLCGVYAIINAVDLIIGFERHSSVPKELFAQLTCGLGAASILTSTTDGLSVVELEQAASLAFGWLSDMHGEALVLERPFELWPPADMASYLSRLGKLISSPETAAIVRFKNPEIDHWSVVTKIDGSTLRLRDSDGLRGLDVAGYRLDDSPSCIRPDQTLVIRRQPFRWMQRVGPGELEQTATPPRQNTLVLNAAMDELDRLDKGKPVAKRGPKHGRNSFIIRGDRIYDLDGIAAALSRIERPKAIG